MASLLGGLLNEYTIIDLRNESSLRGKVTEVDGYMNLELTDCIRLNPQGQLSRFESFFIRGRNIRYVHVPEHLSARKVIEDYLKKPERAPKTKTSFKKKRAMQNQEKTLKEIGFK